MQNFILLTSVTIETKLQLMMFNCLYIKFCRSRSILINYFQGLWCGVLHHIVDEHEWILPHGDNGIQHCLHGPLTETERNKTWLHPRKHCHILKDLANVVLDKRLLGKVGYYLNFRQVFSIAQNSMCYSEY